MNDPPSFNWDDTSTPGDFDCIFDEIRQRADVEHEESDAESDADRVNLIDSISAALFTWYVTYVIKDNAMDALLKILRATGFEELPATTRALKGNEKVNVLKRSGMEYVYLGCIKAGLARCLAGGQSIPSLLALSFNIDGLPVFSR